MGASEQVIVLEFLFNFSTRAEQWNMKFPHIARPCTLGAINQSRGMKKMFYTTCCIILISISLSSCEAQSKKDAGAEKIVGEIQKSHVDANAPERKLFDSLLTRDLQLYFKSKYQNRIVKWELLRDGPTQSGVSYPKYYVWVTIKNGDKIAAEGAARVEAIEKENFQVTDFVEKNKIKNKSIDIDQIFPAAVCERIRRKVN
jgi:hypothetical protein